MVCRIMICTGLIKEFSIRNKLNAGFRIMSYHMIYFSSSSVWQVTVELQKLVKAISI